MMIQSLLLFCCYWAQLLVFGQVSSLAVTRTTTTRTTPSKQPPPPVTTIVICPGFGNAVIDYVTPLNSCPTKGFQYALEQRGFKVHIVPVERYDWIRVALGLFDFEFWKSNQRPSGWAYGWYLQRVLDTIEHATTHTPVDAAVLAQSDRASTSTTGSTTTPQSSSSPSSILVVAHSAGGWLARAALGELENRQQSNYSHIRQSVCGLVTLGTPHLPPPQGIPCATRGALRNTNVEYPGAYLKDIVYVSVAGNAITGGVEDQDKRAVDDVYAKRGEGSAQNVAKINYEALVGQYEGVAGDGVIPISIAHLEGSEQITLDGVLHSINEAGTILPTDSWYGSEQIVDQWLSKTLEKLNQMSTS